MPKTRTGLVKKTLKQIDEGTILGIDSPVRLDDLEIAEDLFGQQTADIDVAIDDIVTCKPTGHRTWSSSEDWAEHFMNQGNDYILD